VKYLPGLSWNLNLLISVSQVARITSVSHWCPAEEVGPLKPDVMVHTFYLSTQEAEAGELRDPGQLA
jgi:hypothetical protein